MFRTINLSDFTEMDAILKLIEKEKVLELRKEAISYMESRQYVRDVGKIFGFPVKITIDIDWREG